jgi:hypothetical protein
MLYREGRPRVKLQIVARVEAACRLVELSLIKVRCRIRIHCSPRRRDQARIPTQGSIWREIPNLDVPRLGQLSGKSSGAPTFSLLSPDRNSRPNLVRHLPVRPSHHIAARISSVDQ